MWRAVMDSVNTYISVLHGSLRKKLALVKELLEFTKEQNIILNEDDVDIDSFDKIVSEKDIRINEVLEIDKGFDSVFNKIGSTIKANPQEYRQQILELQNLIRTITDIGVEIEGLENKNKEKFSKFILAKREEIKDFKKSNNTAASYYKNMSNQHQEWKSYFVDRKN